MFRTILATLALSTTLPAATRIFQKFEGDGFDGELAALANFDALGLDVLPAGIPGVGVKKKGELIEKGLNNN